MSGGAGQCHAFNCLASVIIYINKFCVEFSTFLIQHHLCDICYHMQSILSIFPPGLPGATLSYRHPFPFLPSSLDIRSVLGLNTVEKFTGTLSKQMRTCLQGKYLSTCATQQATMPDQIFSAMPLHNIWCARNPGCICCATTH